MPNLIQIRSRLALDIFYLRTKFGDSRFSRSEDMIEASKLTSSSAVVDEYARRDESRQTAKILNSHVIITTPI